MNILWMLLFIPVLCRFCGLLHQDLACVQSIQCDLNIWAFSMKSSLNPHSDAQLSYSLSMSLDVG